MECEECKGRGQRCKRCGSYYTDRLGCEECGAPESEFEDCRYCGGSGELDDE